MRLRTASTLAVFAVFLIFGAASANAANEIAYQCDLDVCLLDPANPGAVTNLTANGSDSYDEKPIWSPDGKKVAFVSDFTASGHGQRNVFVMEPEAPGQAVNLATQITHYSSEGKMIAELAWSPDGSRIAYTRGNNAGDDKVWVVNADGTTTFPLEIGGGGAKRHPTWSPDSSKIAYAVVKNEPEQIYVAPSTGGFGQPLPNGVGHEPNWSPDGSRIAFDAYHSGGFGYIDLHIVTPDGSGAPLIVPGAFTEWSFSAWSPDGGRIAYRATGSGGATVYRVMNAGGGGDHPLASPGEGDARYASWSPDGSRIVYEGALIGNIGAHNLYLANSDGSGGAQPLTSDGKSQYPAWRVVRSTPQAPPPNPGSQKPKVVWITKRIPWTAGGYIRPMLVFCPVKDCTVKAEGSAKGRASSRPRPWQFAAASAGKKPRKIVVGRGKVKIPAGQQRAVKLKVTKKGAALIKSKGSIRLAVKAVITAPGEKKITLRKTVRVYLAKKK